MCGMVAPPRMPLAGQASGFFEIRRGGELLAGEPLQAEVCHLSHLRFGVVQRRDERRNYFLRAQIPQPENPVHPIGDLGGVKAIEERLVRARGMKKSECAQHVAAQRIGTGSHGLDQIWNKRRVAPLRQQERRVGP